jgi:hypothetical protein
MSKRANPTTAKRYGLLSLFFFRTVFSILVILVNAYMSKLFIIMIVMCSIPTKFKYS